MLWVFKGCGYVGICYGYLRECGYVYGYLRDVVMLWLFKGCSYIMGI